MPGGSPSQCRRARSVYNVLPSRQTQCRVRAEAGVHQHGRSFTDRPSTSRGSHGFLAPPGTHGVLRQRRSDDPQSGAVLPGGTSVPVAPGPHKQGLPPREQAGGPMGSWHQPGTHGVPSARRRADLVFGKSANTRPEPTTSDSQMLRFCQAGRLLPAPSGPHQQALPMGAPWQQTGTHGFLATRRNPLVPGKGVVMIHRLWSVANPTPASAVHPFNE